MFELSSNVLTKLAIARPPSAFGESAFCWYGLQNSCRRSGGEFVRSEQISGFKREFDPGSESTLAACLTHASRTRKWSNPRSSGKRVSNTWVTYLRVGDNVPKGTLIPHDILLLEKRTLKLGIARPGA